EFLNMGGYAFYVWLAYGVTFGSLIILIITSIRQKKLVLRQIGAKVRREERLKKHNIP
ncbi:heme exporter protein CcmD, partial [Shewanella sp. 10N.286.52.B9]